MISPKRVYGNCLGVFYGDYYSITNGLCFGCDIKPECKLMSDEGFEDEMQGVWD